MNDKIDYTVQNRDIDKHERTDMSSIKNSSSKLQQKQQESHEVSLQNVEISNLPAKRIDETETLLLHWFDFTIEKKQYRDITSSFGCKESYDSWCLDGSDFAK